MAAKPLQMLFPLALLAFTFGSEHLARRVRLRKIRIIAQRRV